MLRLLFIVWLLIFHCFVSSGYIWEVITAKIELIENYTSANESNILQSAYYSSSQAYYSSSQAYYSPRVEPAVSIQWTGLQLLTHESILLARIC